MGIKLSTIYAKKIWLKATRAFRSVVLLAAAALVILPPNQYVAAKTYNDVEEFIDKFAANNIMFYNPLDCVGGKSGGSTILPGNDTKEKMWNYFIGKGFNDAQTAGILGNAFGESGFIISRASNSSYWGLFQWYWEYAQDLKQKIDEAGLTKYTGTEYWEDDSSIPEDDFNKLLQIELDYAMENNNEEWQSTIKEKDGDPHEPEYAAEVFLVHFERAVNGSEPLQYYEDKIYHGSMLYQGVTNRNTAARDIYEEYAGKGTTAQGTGGYTITDGGNVTWIGDSLTAIWEATLKEMLPNIELNAQSGKSFNHDEPEGSGSTNGMKILDGMDSVRDIFVFALGSNDWDVTDEQIKTVHDAAIQKGAKVVVFMTAHTRDGNYDAFNSKIKSFAEANSDTLVADWEAMTKGHEDEFFLASDGVHEKDESIAKKYFQMYIDVVNNGAVAMTAEECCDPKDGTTGSSSVWNGNKFMMTEGQARGMVAMISNENAGSVAEVKTTASQMANRFDKYGSSYGEGIEGLINYVKTSRWYDSGTGEKYDENYDASAEYIDAVKDVLIEGNRTIPPQVVQFATGTSQWIAARNEGTEINVDDRDQFKSGVTEIEELFGDHAKWIFYQWADPDAKSGDPFGYEIGDAPDGNSTAGAQSSTCCDKSIGGVTKMEIDGHTYAFPLAGATKANYLNESNFDSMLSGLPCPSLSCHHTYHALDMGVKMSMISGDEADKYGGSADDMMYFSAGAPVVAFTSGTIAYSSEYHNISNTDWYDKCGQIGLEGDDGNYYWLGHLDYAASKVNAGDHVEAGQEISKVGAPQCAQDTQSHLHIDNIHGTNVKPDTWTIEVMNQLWEKLPDSDGGTGMTTCSSGSLPAGGMNQQQADEFMQLYKDLPCPQVDDPWGIAPNSFPDGCGHCLTNCVEFSLYFVNRYTTAHSDGLPDGANVVSALLASDQGFIDGGHTPKAYAIFSHNSGSHGGDGHTGVVLNVDESAGTILIGEAGCDTEFDWIGAHEYSLSNWKDNPNMYYAYTDNILK